MESNKILRIVIVLFGVSCALILLISIMTVGAKRANRVNVGFVMTGSIDSQGYNGLHYMGIKNACEKMDANLCIEENILEDTGECKNAVKRLVDNESSIIFLSSFGYQEELKREIDRYPRVRFFCNAVESDKENVNAYMVRYYQARYLSGIVAGRMTKTNEIGYVAAKNNVEVVRGINAFTLGVRKVNPKALVKVIWTDTWDDEQVEQEKAQELIDHSRIDLITYHQNKPNVIAVAENNQIMSIGYHLKAENASDLHLTAVVCDWQQTYEELIREYMHGSLKKGEYSWLGMERGVVGLEAFSPLVDDDTRKMVKEAQKELEYGKDVFSDEIIDNQGKIRCRTGEAIADEVLLNEIDWLVEGVEVYESGK